MRYHFLHSRHSRANQRKYLPIDFHPVAHPLSLWLENRHLTSVTAHHLDRCLLRKSMKLRREGLFVRVTGPRGRQKPICSTRSFSCRERLSIQRAVAKDGCGRCPESKRRIMAAILSTSRCKATKSASKTSARTKRKSCMVRSDSSEKKAKRKRTDSQWGEPHWQPITDLQSTMSVHLSY